VTEDEEVIRFRPFPKDKHPGIESNVLGTPHQQFQMARREPLQKGMFRQDRF
jgi:hypothetical protein